MAPRGRHRGGFTVPFTAGEKSGFTAPITADKTAVFQYRGFWKPSLYRYNLKSTPLPLTAASENPYRKTAPPKIPIPLPLPRKRFYRQRFFGKTASVPTPGLNPCFLTSRNMLRSHWNQIWFKFDFESWNRPAGQTSIFQNSLKKLENLSRILFFWNSWSKKVFYIFWTEKWTPDCLTLTTWFYFVCGHKKQIWFLENAVVETSLVDYTGSKNFGFP